MIQSVIKNWESRKHVLENWFKEGNRGTDYESIMEQIVGIFLYDLEEENYARQNYKKIHVIDDGSYQGDMGFLIVPDTYQPSIEDYIITNQYYGSCSGCDLLQGIWGYGDNNPNEEQVRELMILSLHLIQGMKFIGE